MQNNIDTLINSIKKIINVIIKHDNPFAVVYAINSLDDDRLVCLNCF